VNTRVAFRPRQGHSFVFVSENEEEHVENKEANLEEQVSDEIPTSITSDKTDVLPH
jgi:hypothetical protein